MGKVWVKISDDSINSLNALPPKKLIRTYIKGKEICLGKISSGYFAVQNHCPHAGAELNFGRLEDERIICPFHQYSFDPISGRSLPHQGEALKVYPLDLREDGLYIQIKTLF